MNVETYETCIRTLENQIKSRQQERQSMQNTITSLDRDLSTQIHKNKNLRDQLIYLAQTNQNIIDELHNLQNVIKQKDLLIQTELDHRQRAKDCIHTLQTQKTQLTQRLQQSDLLITQQTAEIQHTTDQLNNALQSIQGYQTNLQQKTSQITQIGHKLHQSQQQNVLLNLKLTDLQKQLQLQRQQFIQKLRRTQGSANSLSSDLQLKIIQLQKQIHLSKQFYEDQVATLQFNKESRVAQLSKIISSLESKISSQDLQIARLNEEQKKIKCHYEVQIENNDKVVNTLINEINFLKEEKVQLKIRSSKHIEETSKQVLMLGLEMADRETRAKAAQNEIKTIKEELYRKEKETANLNKEIEKLNLQLTIAADQHSGQKDTVLRKNEQIAELKRFIDNLKKFAEVADKERQNLAKKTAKQIDCLKSENRELSNKLQTASSELQQLRVTNAELEQSVKFLGMQRTSTSSSVSELEALVKSHEYTIEKLQHMLDQTKKVVVDLNKLMKTKLAEIDSLEMSNNLLRKEKVEWIKRDEDYRRRIAEYKTMSSSAKRLNLNETSFMSRPRKSVNEKDKQRSVSMMVSNLIDKQSLFAASSYAQSAMRRKTMTANRADKARDEWNDENNLSGSECESGNESTEAAMRISLVQNAFKKPEIMRGKRKSVDLTEMSHEAPVIPVLIAMKKEGVNLSGDSLQKQSKVHDERVGWEGLSQNVIEALALNASPRSPLSDRDAISNTEYQVQTREQKGKHSALKEQPSQHVVQTKVNMNKETEQQVEKQVSTQTHPQTPTDNLQKIIEMKSNNDTPEFHVQFEEPDPAVQLGSIQQEESNGEANLVEGYQTLEQYEEELRMSIPKKISPINSRVRIVQDPLVEILEDQQLTDHNETSQLKQLKPRDTSISQEASITNNSGDNSAEAQDTVDGINILLDRINTE